MTVKELISRLQEMNPDDIVVLSADSEGNRYSELSGLSDEYNYSDNEIGLRALSGEDELLGYTEEDVMEGRSCVILWPS